MAVVVAQIGKQGLLLFHGHTRLLAVHILHHGGQLEVLLLRQAVGGKEHVQLVLGDA